MKGGEVGDKDFEVKVVCVLPSMQGSGCHSCERYVLEEALNRAL